jgi:predicted enzyme related to lactoylglutathione lyase
VLGRDGYPPGVPCWIDTARQDAQTAVAFYGGLFGWRVEDRMPPGAPFRYFVAQLDGRDVAAVGERPEGTPVWNTYVGVASADEAAVRVADAGGSVLEAPFDIPGAGRMAVFADPAGAVFCVWQAREHRGAQIVNAPGTWNFSDLNTPDPEGAKAFYGAVFGWEASTLGEFTMWRVPGYGRFLEARDPDLRRRQADAGAPPGFEDAIGWLMAATDAQAQWAVTFAVDDADAIADRASELGGSIEMPPFDAGPARVAVLRDPEGARFTVSRYNPGG